MRQNNEELETIAELTQEHLNAEFKIGDRINYTQIKEIVLNITNSLGAEYNAAQVVSTMKNLGWLKKDKQEIVYLG